jgi:hypothetical protein
VRRFHRPDARLQPLEQRHVVGEAAEQRLAEMNVRLHEPGQHVAAACLDDGVVAVFVDAADGGDTAIADRDAAVDDGEPVVHGEDRGVAEEQRRH